MTIRIQGSELWVEWPEHQLPSGEWVTTDKLMYMDANTLVALIGEARAALLQLSDEAGRQNA